MVISKFFNFLISLISCFSTIKQDIWTNQKSNDSWKTRSTLLHFFKIFGHLQKVEKIICREELVFCNYFVLKPSPNFASVFLGHCVTYWSKRKIEWQLNVRSTFCTLFKILFFLFHLLFYFLLLVVFVNTLVSPWICRTLLLSFEACHFHKNDSN